MRKTRNLLCFGWKIQLLASLMDMIHRTSRLLISARPKKDTMERILLCNWASLGDVLLATSVIPLLKAHFPNAKIGFLVSKNSRKVLETCAGIDWIHEVESLPMALCKPGLTLASKLWTWIRYTLKENRAIAKEIAKKNYSCAIDLYPFFPNSISILWHAKIPLRIGFDTGGNSHLLNVIAPWDEERYLTIQYDNLLKKLGIEGHVQPQVAIPKIPLPYKAPYLIFHPCSSGEYKEFPPHFWKELYEKCKKAGIAVYFTGHGAREEAFIEQAGVAKEDRLCGQLSWNLFVATLQASCGVVSVDSVPVHLAAALDVPFAVLYRKYTKLWYPETSKGTFFGKDEAISIDSVYSQIEK